MKARQTFPRGALIGAAVLLAVTVGGVAIVRVTGTPPDARAPEPSPTVASRALRFEDRDGDVVVLADVDGNWQPVEVLESGSNGFLRSVLRGLARARRAEGIGAEIPFRIVQRADGGVMLEDPATDQLIFLQAFGQTNTAAFARLLTAEPDETL